MLRASATFVLLACLPGLLGQPGRLQGAPGHAATARAAQDGARGHVNFETTAAASGTTSRDAGTDLQGSFVWLGSAPTGRQAYAAFRKPLELAEAPQAATLHLFADSRYTVWINGQYVERGPCRFDPIAPEYDTLDVRPYLRRGANVIAVLVHHFHDGKESTDWVSINGRIMRHAPGLTARLDLAFPEGRTDAIRTDATWRGSTRTRFLPSPTDRWENTWSSIPDRIDARRDEGDWTAAGFDDGAWERPVPVDGKQWGPLRSRSIPRLRETEVASLVLLEHARAELGGEAAHWIWTREAEFPAQRHPRWSAPEGERFFRRGFELPAGAADVVIWATADNELDCYFNGRKVGENHGNIDSWTTLQRMDVTKEAKVGRNVVAIRAINKHYGVASDPAGLLVAVTWRLGDDWSRLTSDHRWKGRANAPPGWEQSDHDDSKWPAALALCPYPEGTWGSSLRNYPSGLQVGPAARPLAGELPLTLAPGDQLVIDAGRFVQAYTVLELEAEEGSLVEVEHAQGYLQSGHKPSGSYGRVNQYTARAGRQVYMSGDTFGFKYLVIRARKGRLRLEGVKVVDRLYPFEVVGRFTSSDDLLNRLWEYSVNTVRVCSEDAYVDCATRERTEWMADGFVQAYRVTRVALAGPGPEGKPLHGDPRLLRNLLRHIGQSAQPDGRVKAHHPSDRWDIHGYIEDYACLWIQAIREYHDHTGDLDLARELWPAVRGQLRWFLDRRTDRGLVKARDFVYPGSNPLCYKVCEGTTLNAYLVRTLRDAECLAGRLGQSQEEQTYGAAARALAEAMNRHLWDESAGTYHGGLLDAGPHPPTVPAAFTALCFDIVPPARRPRVEEWLRAHHQEQGGLPYAHHFLFEALHGFDTEEADRLVLDAIRKKWAAMAQGETRTVWEGFGPGENCHEAGAVPAYFLSARVLGVRLDGPVRDRRLRIEPRLGDLEEAGGVVVTELGPVPVRWQRRDPGASLAFDLEVPPGARATLALPLPGEEPLWILDERTIAPSEVQRSGRHAVVEVGPGRHRGRLMAAPAGGRTPESH